MFGYRQTTHSSARPGRLANIWTYSCLESQAQPTSATFHVRPQKRGFVNHFCCLPAQSPCRPHYSLLSSSFIKSTSEHKLGVFGKKRLCIFTQYKTGRRITVYPCSLGLVCCLGKNLAGFPLLCNSPGKVLSPGDSHADV